MRVFRIVAVIASLLIAFPRGGALAAVAGINTAGNTDHPPLGMLTRGEAGPAPGPAVASLVVDSAGVFAYAGTDSTPGKIVKIRLSDLVPVATLTLNTGENRLKCAAIDAANEFAYFGTFTKPGIIVKIRLSDFTRVGALSLNTGENGLTGFALDNFGHLYAGTGRVDADPQHGIVVTVSSAAFTRTSALDVDPGPDGFVAGLPYLDGGFAFFATLTKIYMIRHSDGALVDQATMPAGQTNISCLDLDRTLGHLYVGTRNTPGVVVRLTLANLDPAGVVTLNAGENNVTTMAIDENRRVLYAGVSGNTVAKISLPDFGLIADYKRVGALKLGEFGFFNVLAAAAPSSDAGSLIGTDISNNRFKIPLNNYKGFMFASRVVLERRGRPTDFRYYAHDDVGHVKLGLYDNNNPKRLIWYSNAKSTTAVNGFVTITVANGTPGSLPELPAGTYWLAALVDDPGEIPSHNAASAGDGFYAPQSFNGFSTPILFPVTSIASRWSVFFNYAPHNEAPTDITLSPEYVPENSPNGTTAGQLTVTDPDGDPATFALAVPEAGAGGRFTIAGSDLKVANGSLLNYEVQDAWEIRVRATDPFGLSFEKVILVHVDNVNDAPKNITLDGTRSVVENSPSGTAIGDFGAVDEDFSETYDFNFAAPEGSAGGRFQISSSQLQVGNSALLDYDKAHSHQIRVRETDAGGLTVDKVFTITLINVNEGPTNITLSGERTVNEHAPNNTVVGALATVDQDGGAFVYAFIAPESNAGGRFKAESSQLKVLDGTLLDYNTRHSHAIRLRSTDNGGLFVEKAFTITLLQITNQAPTNIGLSGPRTVNEGSPTGTFIGLLSTVDPNPSQTFTYSFVAPESNAGGRFKAGGGELQVDNGALIDYETRTSHPIRLRSTDQGGLFTDKAFTIQVNNLPEG